MGAALRRVARCVGGARHLPCFAIMYERSTSGQWRCECRPEMKPVTNAKVSRTWAARHARDERDTHKRRMSGVTVARRAAAMRVEVEGTSTAAYRHGRADRRARAAERGKEDSAVGKERLQPPSQPTHQRETTRRRQQQAAAMGCERQLPPHHTLPSAHMAAALGTQRRPGVLASTTRACPLAFPLSTHAHGTSTCACLPLSRCCCQRVALTSSRSGSCCTNRYCLFVSRSPSLARRAAASSTTSSRRGHLSHGFIIASNVCWIALSLSSAPSSQPALS